MSGLRVFILQYAVLYFRKNQCIAIGSRLARCIAIHCWKVKCIALDIVLQEGLYCRKTVLQYSLVG